MVNVLKGIVRGGMQGSSCTKGTVALGAEEQPTLHGSWFILEFPQ